MLKKNSKCAKIMKIAKSIINKVHVSEIEGTMDVFNLSNTLDSLQVRYLQVKR